MPTEHDSIARIPRELPLRAGHTLTLSSVIGISREGQLRRDFLAYVERERAHPYRTFLHYNSWYDIGYFSKFDEAGALDRDHGVRHESCATSAASRSIRICSTTAGTTRRRSGNSTPVSPTDSRR